MNEFETKEKSPPPEVRELLRRAAEAGPGYRGQREPVGLDSQAAMARDLANAGVRPPAYLGTHTKWVDRRAKLFEAGEYPDKGVTVTPLQLQGLIQSFDLPVPILIEHAGSPLELGYLTQVEAMEDELFGTLALTEEANALVEKSGAKSLSLGLARDLSEIREVSLVRNPRVPTATMFGSELRFWASLGPDRSEPSDPSDQSHWRGRFEELRSRVEKEEASRQIDKLVRDGKLIPAQVPFAKALLEIPNTIDFDGENRPVHQLLIAMLERQPPHGLFGETAPAGPTSSSDALFLPEEAAFYRRHFPDIALDAIAKKR